MQDIYQWSEEKNQWLKTERGFGFEALVEVIESRGVLDVITNPNPKYAHQHILYVLFKDYVIAVPCILNEDHIFLKTAYPDRKAKNYYLTANHEKTDS